MANPRFTTDRDDKSDVVQTLQVKFDELNKLWSKAEAQLRRIPIPVEVSICYRTEKAWGEEIEPDAGFQIRSFLGFTKLGDGWRICFGEADDCCPRPEMEWKPIADCSAEIRLEAIPHLNALREQVIEEAAAYVGTLETAISNLSGTLDGWDK